MAVLVGKKAPYFEADAVINGEELVEKFSLSQYIGKKYVVFFFYPLDFTFVCPTEILAFQEKLDDFEERNVAVVGCSVDSKHTHLAWLKTELKDGGIQGVNFPLVSDITKTISENYDVLGGEYGYNEDGEMEFLGEAVAYRGLFLIDKQGVVRHQVVNDEPFGRNIDEAIRMVDALQHYEEHGELCPANWRPGQPSLKESIESVSHYLLNKGQ
jgi:peroxiredoxin (alkyl hydroperoxide reductase subunit C)